MGQASATVSSGCSSSCLPIGQAAQAAGLTRKAVRRYEAKGLLPPAERSAAGYRLYDEADVELLSFIRRARAGPASGGHQPGSHRPQQRKHAVRRSARGTGPAPGRAVLALLMSVKEL
ncbi:MerR family DNA-binding transcriptional regulator [Nonomuraea diastatica]|uniref:MerR family DNA-binding transcriptional regulator n=1 Tax=Nonomuraea diastatica TaxID=1848329 RepID=UPI003CCC7F80